MPKVGNKNFSYTKQGQKAAKAYSKKSGKPMEMPMHKEMMKMMKKK